jgi:O-antigen/teichoic acid export membrane protein
MPVSTFPVDRIAVRATPGPWWTVRVTAPEQTEEAAAGGTGGVVGRAAALRHAGWGFVDQGLSSLTNFGVGVAAARTSTTAEFGAFSVAFATYLIGVGVVRALISEVYAVRYADDVDLEAPPRQRYPDVRGAWGAALIVALLGSVACAVAGALSSGDLRASFFVLAVGLPILVLHDVARFICITRRDAFGAMLFDLAWVIAFGGGLIVATVGSGFPGAIVTFELWVFGAACGLLVAVIRLRALPAIRAGYAFVKGVWRYSARYVGDWVALGATVQFGYYLLGATAGLAVVGELRAAMLLIGPLNIVVAGAATIAVPELRRHYRNRERSLKPATLLTAGLVGMTLLWFGMIVLIPEDLLRDILGDAAADAASFLPFLLLYSVINMAAQGPIVALRATGNARRGTRASVPAAPLVLFGASIGAWITADATGSLVAWAISGALTLVLAVWQLRLALAEPHVEMGGSLDERLDEAERGAVLGGSTEPDPSQIPAVSRDLDSEGFG